MLVDNKFFKISENFFLNVQINLIDKDIILKMQDIKDIYVFVSNFFLEEISVTKLSFNYKLDSGIDIKAYYEISHNPMYITLNYKDGKCCACNILPQKLIIKILNRSLPINDLGMNTARILNKDIVSEHSNPAQKLSRYFVAGQPTASKHSFFKAPLNFTSLKDTSHITKEIAHKSVDKLFSNYLLNAEKAVKLIDCYTNDGATTGDNVDKEICMNVSENIINFGCIDVSKNILNFSKNLKKNVPNLEEAISIYKETTNEPEPSQTDKIESIILMKTCNRFHIDRQNNMMNKENDCSYIQINGSVEPNLYIHSNSKTNITKDFSIEDKNTQALINEYFVNQTDSEINPVLNNHLKITTSISDVLDPVTMLGNLESDIDADFKPKNMRASKLSTKRRRQKPTYEQSINLGSVKRTKSDLNHMTAVKKLVSPLRKESSDVAPPTLNDPSSTLCISINTVNTNVINTYKLSIHSETSPRSTSIIDLTDEQSTPILKIKHSSSKNKFTLSRSKNTVWGLKQFKFMKKKPIRLNVSTPVKNI